MDPVAERAEQMRGARISFTVQAAAVPVGYATQIVLARTLGAHAFGTFNYVFAWCMLLSLAAGLGMPTVALRHLPVYRDTDDHSRVAALVNGSERLALSASAAMALVGCLLAFAFEAHPLPLVIGMCTLPLWVQVQLQAGIARAAGRFRLAFVVPFVQQVGLLAAAAVAASIWGRGLGAAGAVALPAFGAALVLPWLRTELRRGLRRELTAPPTYELRPWLAAGVAFLAVDAAYTVLNRADSLLVGAIGGPSTLALYAAAAGTAGFALLPMVAVGASVVPSFSRHWERGDQAQLEAVAQRAVRWAFWPQLAATAVLAVASGPLLRLFGHDFERARWALLLLFVGQLANTGAGYTGNLMNMTGHQRTSAQSIWIVAVLNVALVILGIELAGVTGAAAGTAISTSLWNLWLYRLARRHVGIYPSIVDVVLGRTVQSRHAADAVLR